MSPLTKASWVNVLSGPPQNSEVRSQFQEFLSLNGHQLEQRPFPDVVQLALSQPDSSEVYKQALLQAQEGASRGRLYLDWKYVHPSFTVPLSSFVLEADG